MTVKDKVGTLARTGVNTAVSLVRHPIGTASMAVGFAKGAAEVSADLVKSTISGRLPAGPDEAAAPDEAAVADSHVTEPAVQEPPTQESPVHEPAVHEPAVQGADGPTEPQVVPKPVPEIDELPEPEVIWANDDPGEPVHTEPKAASRDSEHGGPAGDREEADGYVEEIPVDGEADDSESLVWTSESEQRHE